MKISTLDQAVLTELAAARETCGRWQMTALVGGVRRRCPALCADLDDAAISQLAHAWGERMPEWAVVQRYFVELGVDSPIPMEEAIERVRQRDPSLRGIGAADLAACAQLAAHGYVIPFGTLAPVVEMLLEAVKRPETVGASELAARQVRVLDRHGIASPEATAKLAEAYELFIDSYAVHLARLGGRLQ